MVTGHDICFLCGYELFGVRPSPDLFHAPSPYRYATIGFTGKVTPVMWLFS